MSIFHVHSYLDEQVLNTLGPNGQVNGHIYIQKCKECHKRRSQTLTIKGIDKE